MNKEKEEKIKNNLTDNMKIFYKELVDVTIDFMSNYMYSNPVSEFYDLCSHPSHQG